MFAINHKRTSRLFGLCLLAGTTLALATPPVHAGFNWTPPPPPPPKETAVSPDMAAAPLTPVEGEKAPAAAAPAAPAPAPVAMEAPAPAPAAAMPAPAAPAPATAPEYAEIRGFGSDIPLTMALNQIVPAGYSSSFAPGIDPSTSVSWQGGRPWNVVLNDSLQSAGLTAMIDGHSVRIERVGGSTAGDQMRAAMAAEGAWMGPIEQRYTPEQLAAIGADSKGYRPSYPRHTPRKMDSDRSAATTPATAPQSGDQANAMPTASSPASVTVGAASAQSGPTSLTDHMQQDTMPAAGVSAPPPPPTTLDVNAVSHWKADKGQSLHDTLKAWCDRSNVNLVWESHKDYKINQKVSMSGTFPEAVMKLLTSYNDIKPRPVGQLHPNLPNGPSILIIQNPPGA